MTNNQAIELLKALRPCVAPTLSEAISIAINALQAQDLNKQVTGKLNSDDDTISRRAAIDAVKFDITYAKAIDVNTGESKELFKEGNDALKKAAERIKELPSAHPETVRCKECRWRDDFGHWLGCPVLNTDDDNYCSFAERKTDEQT